jgi:hypothetical protein
MIEPHLHRMAGLNGNEKAEAEIEETWGMIRGIEEAGSGLWE